MLKLYKFKLTPILP